MNHPDPIFNTMSNDDFELINSEIQQAEAQSEDQLIDDLAGMSFVSTIPPKVDNEVPEKIRLWREEMERKLEEKDRQEQEAKEALKVSAQKEMSEWVSKYKDSMEKTKSLNRNNEKEFESPEAAESDAKNMWESITNLCDFSTKGPKNSKDASRMRSIFLQMKSAPKVNWRFCCQHRKRRQISFEHIIIHSCIRIALYIGVKLSIEINSFW